MCSVGPDHPVSAVLALQEHRCQYNSGYGTVLRACSLAQSPAPGIATRPLPPTVPEFPLCDTCLLGRAELGPCSDTVFFWIVCNCRVPSAAGGKAMTNLRICLDVNDSTFLRVGEGTVGTKQQHEEWDCTSIHCMNRK